MCDGLRVVVSEVYNMKFSPVESYHLTLKLNVTIPYTAGYDASSVYVYNVNVGAVLGLSLLQKK